MGMSMFDHDEKPHDYTGFAEWEAAQPTNFFTSDRNLQRTPNFIGDRRATRSTPHNYIILAVSQRPRLTKRHASPTSVPIYLFSPALTPLATALKMSTIIPAITKQAAMSMAPA